MNTLILRYIKSWINDILNCRSNRKQLELTKSNLNVAKLTIKSLEDKVNTLKDEYDKQLSNIKTVITTHTQEREEIATATTQATEELAEITDRSVYQNVAIDKDGLDTINDLIKGKL